MRLIYSVGFVLLALSHNAYCQRNRETASSQAEAPPEPSHAQSLDVVANSVTNLAQKISLAIASQKSKTEIFSPVSIAGALSLLLLGSGGTTKDELMKLMGFQNEQISFTEIHKSFGKLFRELVSNDPTLQANVPWRETDKCNIYDDDEYESRGSFRTRPKRDSSPQTPFDRYSHEIQLANGIFIDKNFNLNPTYAKTAQELYQSEVEKLSFAENAPEATNRINSWVNENTHGKIPEIFPTSVDTNTVMILASALYFKALWEDMFIEGGTRPRNFYPNGKNDTIIKVDMMAHGGCFPYYNSPELDAAIVGIPYKNNQSTMYVIKPNESNRQALQELMAKLNSQALDEFINRMKKTTAIILFPKMHITSTMNLKKTLKILGVRSIFHASRSDLSAITGEPKPTAASPNPTDPNTYRPAVNLPNIPHKIKTTANPNKLIFSRFENETTPDSDDGTTVTDIDQTEAPTTTTDDQPTTLTPSTTNKPKRRGRRNVSYKTPTEVKGKQTPLNSKDFFLNKRIVKPTAGKKTLRTRRDTSGANSSNEKMMLYVSDAVHKVDLEINERGTEGGAATAITLNRSGTNAVFRADEPFLIVIRNDRTKLPLFYGAVFDPSE